MTINLPQCWLQVKELCYVSVSVFSQLALNIALPSLFFSLSFLRFSCWTILPLYSLFLADENAQLLIILSVCYRCSTNEPGCVEFSWHRGASGAERRPRSVSLPLQRRLNPLEMNETGRAEVRTGKQTRPHILNSWMIEKKMDWEWGQNRVVWLTTSFLSVLSGFQNLPNIHSLNNPVYLHLHLCILQKSFAFFAFPGNRTHDLGWHCLLLLFKLKKWVFYI